MTEQEIKEYIIEQLKNAGLEKEAEHLTRAKSSDLDWFVGDTHCVITDGSGEGVRVAVNAFVGRLLNDKSAKEHQLRRQEDMKAMVDVFIPFVADTALKINAELRKRKLDVGPDGLLVLTGAVIVSSTRF